MNEGVINIAMYVTYGLLAIAALAAIIFSLFHMFGTSGKLFQRLSG